MFSGRQTPSSAPSLKELQVRALARYKQSGLIFSGRQTTSSAPSLKELQVCQIQTIGVGFTTNLREFADYL
ncbi:MAG: hypothetical protein U9N54_07375 [candidate division Zixibacteria bacterium]|nr:hypothetical protein [candidate division Zixibacteria bacterium]